MKPVTATMVKIYLTEGDKLLNSVMNYLHNEVKVRGVTVFRAINGFGRSGIMHSTALLSMSFDLPLVLEFFDTPKKVEKALAYIIPLVGNQHVVSWQATCYE